jgi:cell division protein FtsI/penicillin-binding protein 2
VKWLASILLWAPGLFDQSVVRILTRDFPQAHYVLVDVQSREVLGTNFETAEPIPMGSLVKPFTAIAAPEAKARRCNAKECWQPAGHGNVTLAEAVAHSCNSFMLAQASAATPDRIHATASRFGLDQPKATDKGTLIGLGAEWPVAPSRLARAFAVLATATDSKEVLQGMRLCARTGTAKFLNGAALAKTGTAPCSHRQKAPGDGYVAMLYPPAAPRYVLLVQVHGVSGAEATRTAAKMLAVLQHGK